MGYTICGLFYNDSPKSRIEKLLIDIYNKESGGGGGESDLDIGSGLVVRNGAINVNTASSIEIGNSLPADSNGVYQQIDKADRILQMI